MWRRPAELRESLADVKEVTIHVNHSMRALTFSCCGPRFQHPTVKPKLPAPAERLPTDGIIMLIIIRVTENQVRRARFTGTCQAVTSDRSRTPSTQLMSRFNVDIHALRMTFIFNSFKPDLSFIMFHLYER